MGLHRGYALSYAGAGPLFLPLSLTASAVDEMRRGERNPDANVVANILSRVGNSVLQVPFVEGLSEMFDAIRDPAHKGARWAQNFATGFVPLSAATRTAAQTLDTTTRDPRSIGEAVEANIPGMSTSVPPKIDAFGAPVQHDRLTPLADVSSAKSDPVREELGRLHEQGMQLPAPGKRKDTITLPGKDATVGGKRTATLTEDEDVAIRTARGRLLRLRLEGTMQTNGYRSATDQARTRVIAYQKRQVADLIGTRARALKAQGKTLTIDQLLPVQVRGRALADLEPAA